MQKQLAALAAAMKDGLDKNIGGFDEAVKGLTAAVDRGSGVASPFLNANALKIIADIQSEVNAFKSPDTVVKPAGT